MLMYQKHDLLNYNNWEGEYKFIFSKSLCFFSHYGINVNESSFIYIFYIINFNRLFLKLFWIVIVI